MIVERLGLVDFRNYAVADVALDAGANVFIGRNGQGKTNLAEAIAFFATLGSHRVSQDAPMVREGADAAIVRMRLAYGDRRVQLEAQLNRAGGNKARVNGSAVRTAELPRYAHVVLFAPEDLQIVRGDPSARRRFADQLLVQRSPRMAGVLADYDRVVKQRNALLKSARARGVRGEGLSTLEVWDDKLVQFGTDVIRARLALAGALAAPVRDAYASIAGADHRPELEWALSIAGADAEEESRPPSAVTPDGDRVPSRSASATGGVAVGISGSPTPEQIAQQFRAALAAKRSAELDRGITLAGPHRDDLLLRVRGLPVKGYASHGESWSVALALRLASARLLREQSSLGDPIVILDDVFAELDVDRRSRLAGIVADFEQVVVTAAVEEDVPVGLRARTLRVEAGTVRAQEPADG
ncbi:MAG: DNA replication/repair protein RecF [Microbacterium sp.]